MDNIWQLVGGRVTVSEARLVGSDKIIGYYVVVDVVKQDFFKNLRTNWQQDIGL